MVSPCFALYDFLIYNTLKETTSQFRRQSVNDNQTMNFYTFVGKFGIKEMRKMHLLFTKFTKFYDFLIYKMIASIYEILR